MEHLDNKHSIYPQLTYASEFFMNFERTLDRIVSVRIFLLSDTHEIIVCNLLRLKPLHPYDRPSLESNVIHGEISLRSVLFRQNTK
jgi:hypothetical protein